MSFRLTARYELLNACLEGARLIRPGEGALPEVPIELEAVEPSSGDLPAGGGPCEGGDGGAPPSEGVRTSPSPYSGTTAKLSAGESTPEGDDTRWTKSVTH